MELVLLILAGASLLAMATFAFIAWRAPEGYEDEDGFHMGQPPRDDE